MTSGKRRCVVPIILYVGLSLACEQRASDEIDPGSLEGSVYRNKYFGLAVTVPRGWSIEDRQSMNDGADIAGEMLAGKDKRLRADMAAAEKHIVNLLVAYRYPLNAPVPSNPSIALVAERVRHVPEVRSGRDYLHGLSRLLRSSDLEFVFPCDIQSETVGGVEFDALHVEMSLAEATVKQTYYATVMRGYVLGIILSFMNAEEESALKGVLSTVAFERKQ